MNYRLPDHEKQRAIKALEDQRNNGRVREVDEGFMFTLLLMDLMGMDGFKFCWPEEASRNRQLILARMK